MNASPGVQPLPIPLSGSEREIEILPTKSNTWVGTDRDSGGGGVSAGLDWLTMGALVPLWRSALAADRDGPDTPAEAGLERWALAVLNSATPLGPCKRHPTEWYREGTFADDGSWAVKREGRGRCAGSVIVETHGSYLKRLPDRGLSVAQTLQELLGLTGRRVDVMADSAKVEGAIRALYMALEDGDVTLPRGLAWKFEASPTGHTLYLGSRSSDEYVCIYDLRGVDRVEVRTRGESSQALLAELLAGVRARAVVGAHLDRYGRAIGSGPGRLLRRAIG